MPLYVNTNVLSLNAQRNLTTNTNMLGKSMEKLASGYRINRSADDAAGLALSENLRGQIRGANKALANVQDGVGVLNIVDGAYQQITDNLQRMRELAVQAANDTYSTNQRNAISAEMSQLSADITRIANATQFNGVKLMDGTLTAYNIQVGPNTSGTVDSLDLATLAGSSPFSNANATTLAVNALGVGSTASAQGAITSIDAALTTVNNRRGAIGAITNRLEGAANNLQIAIENFSASESRIRNVDVAAESANLIRNQILQQSAATVLAQANQTPSLALSLLQ